MWSDLPDTDDDEPQSADSRNRGAEEQNNANAASQGGEGAETDNAGEAPARGSGLRVESSHGRASSSTDAIGSASGERVCEAEGGRNGTSAESTLPPQDPPERLCVEDPMLLGLLSDQRYWDDEAPTPSPPHWSRWGRCQRCSRRELDLELCRLCERQVCPWRCGAGVDGLCWDCIPVRGKSAPALLCE